MLGSFNDGSGRVYFKIKGDQGDVWFSVAAEEPPRGADLVFRIGAQRPDGTAFFFWATQHPGPDPPPRVK